MKHSNKLFEYIFLDLDGPILEGMHRHYQCYKDIIASFGGTPLNIEVYWDMKRSKVTRDIILKESNFQASYADFFESWMNKIESQPYLELDLLKPKVSATLASWKNITDNIVLVTMRQKRDNLIQQLKYLEIYSFFDEVIDCPPHRKNTKYEALKHKAFNSAIFIGDTEEDTNTAKKLNITSIGITNGLRKRQFLDADYYFPEIKDIDFSLLF